MTQKTLKIAVATFTTAFTFFLTWYATQNPLLALFAVLFCFGSLFLALTTYTKTKQPIPPPTPPSENNTTEQTTGPIEAPEVIPPIPQTQQTAIQPKTTDFDNHIISLIDKSMKTAQVSTNLTMTVPISREVDYHGQKIKIDGDFTIKMNGETQTAQLPAEIKPQPQPTQPPRQKEIDD